MPPKPNPPLHRRIAMACIAAAGLSVLAGSINRSCHKEPPKVSPKEIYDAQMYMRFRGEAMKRMPEAQHSHRRRHGLKP